MIGAPSDEELLEVIAPAIDEQIITLERRPYEYATSFPLEELHLGLGGGKALTLIFKDLAWERLLPDARSSKPRFFHDPVRSIETQRRLLDPNRIGPRCYAAVIDASRDRHWLVLEKVAGVELWQVGDVAVWETVAVWLARFHAMFSTEDAAAFEAAHLVVYDRDALSATADRARVALRSSADDRSGRLLELLDGYDDVVSVLASDERRFIHGEFYASNVLVGVGDDLVRVCPIDWEMAGLGSRALDLAALTAGWDAPARRAMVDAYAAAATPLVSGARLHDDVERGRLHLALQWVGWAAGWRPPPEHARDWVGEALSLSMALGL